MAAGAVTAATARARVGIAELEREVVVDVVRKAGMEFR